MKGKNERALKSLVRFISSLPAEWPSQKRCVLTDRIHGTSILRDIVNYATQVLAQNDLV